MGKKIFFNIKYPTFFKKILSIFAISVLILNFQNEKRIISCHIIIEFVAALGFWAKF
jgi:hypothetical protein